MKLINFPGLNCYTNSIVTIAHELGVDFSSAFSCMWSETVFHFQPSRKSYLSNRFLRTLESLGAQLVVQLVESPQQATERLSELSEGELIILGIDAFYLPWSQFYNKFHGPHFFTAQYTKRNSFLCYDPTFDINGADYSRSDIIAHAYDISRILPVARSPCPFHPLYDAEAVIALHPAMRVRLGAEIDRCQVTGTQPTAKLAKYMDALQSNRYLYRYYLEHLPAPHHKKGLLMNEEYFAKWAAIKNGLNKASITGQETVFQEVRQLLAALLDEEIKIAEEILSYYQ